MSLGELFGPTGELDVAERIFSAVPDDIGELPYPDARMSAIVENAYSDMLLKMTPEKRREYEKRMLEYCERHRLMERMQEAGLIESRAFYLGKPLWNKVKKEE
ncbi:hypothetical protein KY336_04810 [Candidatus Woesearchaeota archaeon]|nr:hypothetical protein [Candidatus Woesearchaeota archaeon]